VFFSFTCANQILNILIISLLSSRRKCSIVGLCLDHKIFMLMFSISIEKIIWGYFALVLNVSELIHSGSLGICMVNRVYGGVLWVSPAKHPHIFLSPCEILKTLHSFLLLSVCKVSKDFFEA
jgi:hypothetical protein